MYPRLMESRVRLAASAFPAVILTGPRRVGKTTLLRTMFPDAQYVLLEDTDLVEQARSDPRGFLAGIRKPVILDEVQNAPGLLPYVRTIVDSEPDRKGNWLLTGSQEFPLMKGVSESMAGRAAVMQLWPLSVAETGRLDLLGGGYPESLALPQARSIWFESYLRTYLERDLRGLADIRDLMLFRRFLGLIAARHGQFVNKADLAGAVGVSAPTVSRWLDLLVATGQVLLIPPYFENLSKRLIKSPKLYIADSGLACHLLNIDSIELLQKSAFYGAVVEGAMAAELTKLDAVRGRVGNLFCLRDYKGFEVDFVWLGDGGSPTFIEVKASQTVRPEDGRRVREMVGTVGGRGAVLHLGPDRPSRSLSDVQAIPIEIFLKENSPQPG